MTQRVITYSEDFERHKPYLGDMDASRLAQLMDREKMRSLSENEQQEMRELLARSRNEIKSLF